ncbi:hypothetical protein LINGRAHAP2_LOCUS5984, partial [Linum grandiflorum]
SNQPFLLTLFAFSQKRETFSFNHFCSATCTTRVFCLLHSLYSPMITIPSAPYGSNKLQPQTVHRIRPQPFSALLCPLSFLKSQLYQILGSAMY